jgi:hypothetical protein
MKFQPLRKKLSTGFVLGSLFIAAGCSASSDNANEDISQKEAFQSQLIKGELFPTRFEMEPVLRANEEPGSLEVRPIPIDLAEPSICDNFGVVNLFSTQSPKLGRFFYSSSWGDSPPDVIYQFEYLYAVNLDSTVFQSEIDKLGDVFYEDSEERCSSDVGVFHEKSGTETDAYFEACSITKAITLECLGNLEVFGGKWSRTTRIESGWFPETPRQTLGIFNVVSRTTSNNARFARAISIITIPKANAGVVLTSIAYNVRTSSSKVSLDAMTETLANIAREAKEKMINKIMSSPTWSELQKEF